MSLSEMSFITFYPTGFDSVTSPVTYICIYGGVYTFIAERGDIQLLWDLTNDTYGLENDEGK